MADVFLSYASQDRDRIVPLVRELESHGLSVWWDRDIQAGVTYDREIEAAIAEARCVVVAWSRSSIESEYVRSEVEDAASRAILIPVLIDDVQPPLAHRRIQSVDLIGWPGRSEDEPQKLVNGIRRVIGTPAAPELAKQRSEQSRRKYWVPAVSSFILLLGIGYYYRETIAFSIALSLPALYFGSPIDQDLAFAVASDGTRIAYATTGEGPTILHVLGQNTHLEKGQNAPIYDNDGLIGMSSRNNHFVRYDGRGTGLSDRNVQDYSIEARVADIEAVVESAGLDRFSILAVSAGGPQAIVYTARNPTRVHRLVLAGAFVSLSHVDAETRQGYEKMLDLYEVAWQTPEVSDMQAAILIGPDGDELDKKIMGEFMRRAMTGRDLANMQRAMFQIDVSEEAQMIRVPTLVLQSPDDPIVPLEAGRKLASLISGAKFELVEGGHMASSASTVATRRRALQFINSGR